VKLTHTITVPADGELVWAFITDIPRVAPCVPGVERVERVEGPGPERHRGLMRVALGPVRLALEGEVRLVRRDDAARVAQLDVAAADAEAGGSVAADVRLSVVPVAAGGTRVDIDTDARVMGRIGEFGQHLIRRKADQTMAGFADALARALTGARA
jgi:carbon monoxide dehydrogenase subunit G